MEVGVEVWSEAHVEFGLAGVMVTKSALFHHDYKTLGARGP